MPVALQDVLKTIRDDEAQAALKKIYTENDFELLWSENEAAALNKALRNAAENNGLNPAEYQTAFDKDYTHQDEIRGAEKLIAYVKDVKTGRVRPQDVDPKIFLPPQPIDWENVFSEMTGRGNPDKKLAAFEPPHKNYKILKQAYNDLRNEKKVRANITLPKDVIVRPGDTHEAIRTIRAFLDESPFKYDGKLPNDLWTDDGRIKNGDFNKVVDKKEVKNAEKTLEAEAKEKKKAEKQKSAKAENKNYKDIFYDETLARRVAEFQYRHGLKTDGVIGPETLSAMRWGNEDRRNKIAYAMERWRWLPDDLGAKHVFVNIAGYYVSAHENGKEVFTMPIIVGEVAHQTPVFSSVIENVKLHPDWTAPDSIAQRYLIDKIQNNPAVINRLGYQLINTNTGNAVPFSSVGIGNLDNINLANYQFRQKPGRNNALGMARFSIKNNMAIFMHGTPSENLFDKDNRVFSSGCIRVEEPFEMAWFLLKNTGISQSELRRKYELSENEHPDTTFMDLKDDVPVHLTYMTAWVDQGETVNFTEDIYGRDEDLAQMINQDQKDI